MIYKLLQLFALSIIMVMFLIIMFDVLSWISSVQQPPLTGRDFGIMIIVMTCIQGIYYVLFKPQSNDQIINHFKP
jgi:hypothetical protein